MNQVEKIPNALLRCIHESNDAVLEFAKSQGIEGKTGTTLVAAVVHNQDLYYHYSMQRHHEHFVREFSDRKYILALRHI